MVYFSTRRWYTFQLIYTVIPQLKDLIDRIGDKDSPFVLGLLKEGYTEQTFENLSHRQRQKINRNLTIISKKLELPLPLQLKTARDSYAMVLKRNGVSKNKIGEALGHSNSIVTGHYFGSLDVDEIFEINNHLL